MKENLFMTLFKILRYRFNLDDDRAPDSEVISNIKKGVEFKGVNLWTLIFAIFIASIGLNVNSTAVIIGAMLISPIMGPIMGVGLGAAILDFSLIRKALKNLFIATIISIITSTIYFSITPLSNAQSELLARTSPTIWDVLIALFGGLAGIVAGTRKNYNNIVPGVAIATALMPPLCTAGYGIATMQWNYFFGAFYLYLINSVFISISTFVVIRALNFNTAVQADKKLEWNIRKWIIFIAVATITPSIYLAYLFVQHEIFNQRSENFITNEIINTKLTMLNKSVKPDKKEIQITLLGEIKKDSLLHDLDLKKLVYGLSDAKIIVKSNGLGVVKTKGINLEAVKRENMEQIIKKQEISIQEKDLLLKSFQDTLKNKQLFKQKQNETYREFVSLYGEPNEFTINETSIIENDSTIKRRLLVYIKTNKKINAPTQSQIKSWIETKFNTEDSKLIITK